MKKEDDLEDLFKEKFENFEADVSPSVWENVRTALKGFGLGFLVKTLINKIGTNTIIAVVSSAATVISTVLVMNWSNTPKDTASKENKTTTATTIETPATIVDEPVMINQDVQKPVVTGAVENKETEANTKNEAATKKIDEKEMAAVIDKFSVKRVASIFASPVSGTVPLQVSLINTGTGKINKWSYGDSKQVETEISPIHFYNEPGIYTVKLASTNADGKIILDSVKIEVLGNSSLSSIPTDFSPNGDGNVDEFVFKSKNMVNLKAIIFDKKGNTVYQKESNDAIIWNGKNINGQNAKEGTYFYIINAEGVDGKKYEQKGSINLTR